MIPDTLEMLRDLLAPLTNPALRLECDGFNRAAGYLIARRGHTFYMYGGSVADTSTGRTIAPHHWIEVPSNLGLIRVDYCLRMWFPDVRAEQVPHGAIVAPWPTRFLYAGSESYLSCSPTVFRALTTPWPEGI